MIELTTTVKCDCGNKIRIRLYTGREIENPHGLTLEDITTPYSNITVTDGKLIMVKNDPVIEYKFVCNKCLGENK